VCGRRRKESWFRALRLHVGRSGHFNRLFGSCQRPTPNIDDPRDTFVVRESAGVVPPVPLTPGRLLICKAGNVSDQPERMGN
jgi:hypothetical protein